MLPLAAKVSALNCLVFDTPHSFWVTQATKTKTGNDLATAGSPSRYGFLGYGDWTCTLAPDEPFLPSCVKHDVAYSSLQKFVGTASQDSRDSTWNARNKFIADAKLFTDLIKDATDNRDSLGSCVRFLPSIRFCGHLKHMLC